jgi:RIO-like serine/threonine protein kinase
VEMRHFTQWQYTVIHPRQRDKTSRDIDKIVRYGRKKKETGRDKSTNDSPELSKKCTSLHSHHKLKIGLLGLGSSSIRH